METLNELVGRYPALKNCSDDIERAREILVETFDSGNKLMICGNGGSAADSDHIVGELSKGFLKKRPVPERDREKLKELYPDEWEKLADGLQCGLPAVSLHSQSALLTAFVNDVEPEMMYAQELYALGKDRDALIAISTSGNSKNVVNAAKLARIMGIKVIALTGERESALSSLADVCIRVGEHETYRVQELHLPVYHYLCAAVEDRFYAE